MVHGDHRVDAKIDEIELAANGLTFSADACGDGPVALCLHGFPDDRHSFRHQLPALARAGRRAIAPTLRGYEPSSQPGREIAHYHPMRVASRTSALQQPAARGASCRASCARSGTTSSSSSCD